MRVPIFVDRDISSRVTPCFSRCCLSWAPNVGTRIFSLAPELFTFNICYASDRGWRNSGAGLKGRPRTFADLHRSKFWYFWRSVSAGGCWRDDEFRNPRWATRGWRAAMRRLQKGTAELRSAWRPSFRGRARPGRGGHCGPKHPARRVFAGRWRMSRHLLCRGQSVRSSPT